MLPDDILLAIFDFCVEDDYIGRKPALEAWQILVHVCRRWRNLVFASPRRLDLRLVCSGRTPAKDTLDVWPALPLLIECYNDVERLENADNIIAVLERRNRLREIELLKFSSLDLETILVAMQVPFSELTRLRLSSDEETVPILPDSFLGGTALPLRELYFRGISFPALPKLPMSATRLVQLYLRDIPHSAYISPEVMVTTLSTLTSLEKLQLGFQSPRSRPSRASGRPPTQTRLVLTVLTLFSFKGVGEYLDDLVDRIDAPRLSNLYITFFNQIVFDTPQSIKFISRTPTLKLLKNAEVAFGNFTTFIKLKSQISHLEVAIPCKELDWQVSSVEQVFTSCLPSLPLLEDLYISENLYQQPDWQDNIENTLWLELLHPFTAVKNLYLSEDFARRIVPALQELDGGRATEVLPTLKNIFLEGLRPSGSVQEGIGQFVATRQAAADPVVVSRWDRS